ncbi:MAG TPA: serpin family protein [bacterium]
MKNMMYGFIRVAGSFFLMLIIFCIIISCKTKNKDAGADKNKSVPGSVSAVVDASNQFAFELYRKFNERSKDENIFYSPFSITVALTMAYEGARGQTAKEMQKVLHIPETADLRRIIFAKIINEINKKDRKYKLSTANALWAQMDYKFLAEYLYTIDKYYGGKAANLDFERHCEESRDTINSWVEDQTNGKIKDLIPPGKIDASTKLVLTNAIYFKGTWVMQFDKKRTREGDFETSPVQKVMVPMMRLTGGNTELKYAETEDVQILEMPYEGKDLSMVIILPRGKRLDEIEKSITLKKWSEWRSMLREKSVDVYIPKFKFDAKYYMNEFLKKMGMRSSFGEHADFSGMDGTQMLYIENVIHQAFVEVNEEGTEAAAATEVTMDYISDEIFEEFNANHPFIFAIQERNTGNILFLGRVSDPSKSL